MKCLLLYLDERDKSDGYNIHKLTSVEFPNRVDDFEVTKEQGDSMSRIHNRVQSNLCLLNAKINVSSNLVRVNHLPKNFNIREEFVRCVKQ